MYKEYMLYRQMNEDDLAYSTLKKMYEMYPDDYDITLAMSAQHMKKAEKLMELGLYSEGKDIELLHQHEALQRGTRYTGYDHTPLPGLWERNTEKSVYSG